MSSNPSLCISDLLLAIYASSMSSMRTSLVVWILSLCLSARMGTGLFGLRGIIDMPGGCVS